MTTNTSTFLRYRMKYQSFLDRINLRVKERWIFFAVVFILLCFRVIYYHRWYIYIYFLGLRLLFLFIEFISPFKDPEMGDMRLDDQVDTSDMTDSKPFIRKLPEFKFWHSLTFDTLIVFFISLFPFLDIPVYWPILLVYFIGLSVLLLQKQYRHMLKHNYKPWDTSKSKKAKPIPLTDIPSQ
mmetsp:Transcript_7956/g.11807  ORF Transcript_7956/g.11807 Transcript_7956/m.11807 type:complete len:182 (+) Transcript_7956:96-641(+)